MGYRSENIDPVISKIADKCEAALLQNIKPKYVYKLFDITPTENGVSINGTAVTLTGNNIKAHLDDCDSMVLLAATLSAEADRVIRRFEITDMTHALTADALASAAIEQVCNIAEEEIKAKTEGKYMTWRFSPGYGDLPISLQSELLTLVDAGRKIGLTVTENDIMIPRKSVTAIIGLSDNPIPPKRRGCAICNMNKTCLFRKRGEHCGA
jgi:hypothetical protein